ncbi:hypothetical protein JKP88DRAFT_254796 [Tribonema minus]|uniref:Uncharacterized protein n=1 Tax=Tribonema minus TaxID=303371 RepID=A0A835ZBC0_9STRA|nr:hypothetical protein JKP88DRAFT_254796 [Tribonema minus]
MSSEKLRSKLAALPKGAPVALLSSNKLAVAAESTVAAAVAAVVYWAAEEGLMTVPDTVVGCIWLRQLDAGFTADAGSLAQSTSRAVAALAGVAYQAETAEMQERAAGAARRHRREMVLVRCQVQGDTRSKGEAHAAFVQPEDSKISENSRSKTYYCAAL